MCIFPTENMIYESEVKMSFTEKLKLCNLA